MHRHFVDATCAKTFLHKKSVSEYCCTQNNIGFHFFHEKYAIRFIHDLIQFKLFPVKLGIAKKTKPENFTHGGMDLSKLLQLKGVNQSLEYGMHKSKTSWDWIACLHDWTPCSQTKVVLFFRPACVLNCWQSWTTRCTPTNSDPDNTAICCAKCKASRLLMSAKKSAFLIVVAVGLVFSKTSKRGQSSQGEETYVIETKNKKEPEVSTLIHLAVMATWMETTFGKNLNWYYSNAAKNF